MTLGQNIQNLRKAAGLSQEALGEALGVSRQAVSKWESDGAVPELDSLIAMSRLFGVTLGQLLQVEEPGPDPEAPGEPKAEAEQRRQREMEQVEAILRRYVEETEARRPAGVRLKGWHGAVLAAVVLAIGLWVAGRFETMGNTISNLQSQISHINGNVSSQIAGITSQVTAILEEQSALTVDCGAELIALDVAQETVTFSLYAVPKTYQADMSVEFNADSHGQTVRTSGVEEEGRKFTGELTCTLTDEITLTAAFTTGEVTQTQLLTVYYGLLEETWPCWVDVMDTGDLINGSVWKEGEMTVQENTLLVSVNEYGSAVSASWELPYAGADPAPKTLRVGLFRNGTLVVWAAPPAELALRGEDGGVFPSDPGSCEFILPAAAFSMAPGDELALAAVVTDNYGRERVFAPNPAMVLREDGRLGLSETWEERANWNW